jgi:hypothetical protein
MILLLLVQDCTCSFRSELLVLVHVQWILHCNHIMMIFFFLLLILVWIQSCVLFCMRTCLKWHSCFSLSLSFNLSCLLKWNRDKFSDTSLKFGVSHLQIYAHTHTHNTHTQVVMKCSFVCCLKLGGACYVCMLCYGGSCDVSVVLHATMNPQMYSKLDSISNLLKML